MSYLWSERFNDFIQVSCTKQSNIHQTIWHYYSNNAIEMVIHVRKLGQVMSYGPVTFLTHSSYRTCRQKKNFYIPDQSIILLANFEKKKKSLWVNKTQVFVEW